MSLTTPSRARGAIATVGFLVLTVVAVALVAWPAGDSPTPVLVATWLQVAASVVLAWGRWRRSVLWLVFVGCYFVFLLGRVTVVFAGYHRDGGLLLGTDFSSPGLLRTMLTLVWLFLMAAGIGQLIMRSLDRVRPRGSPLLTWWPRWRPHVWRAALGVLVVSAPLSIVSSLYTAAYVARHGYAASYQHPELAELPGLSQFGGLMLASGLVALATRPTGRRLWLVVGLFLVANMLTVATGRRGEGVVAVLLVVVYLVHRFHVIRPFFRGRRGALASLVIGVAAVVLVVGMVAIGMVRGTESMSASTLLLAPLALLYSQGYSINVVGYAIVRRDDLLAHHWSFGPVIEFVQYRVLSLFGADYSYLRGQSAERALEGNQLAHTLSYLVNPQSYLAGRGLGSSAVAEVWLDFGKPGLVLGGLAYGVLIGVLSWLLTRRFLGLLVAMLLMRLLFLTPRASYSQFLVGAFNAPILAGLVLIAVIAIGLRLMGARRRRSG